MKLKATLHNDSTHRVLDIQKSDDGLISYILEGIDGPVYAKDVKNVYKDKDIMVATPVPLKKGSSDEPRSARYRTKEAIQEKGPEMAPGTLGGSRLESGLSPYEEKMMAEHGVPYHPEKLFDKQSSHPLRSMDQDEFMTHFGWARREHARGNISTDQMMGVLDEAKRRTDFQVVENKAKGVKISAEEKKRLAERAAVTSEWSKEGSPQFGVAGQSVPSKQHDKTIPEDVRRQADSIAAIPAEQAKYRQAQQTMPSKPQVNPKDAARSADDIKNESRRKQLLSLPPEVAHKVYTGTPEHQRQYIHNLVDVETDHHPDDASIITGVRFKPKGSMAKGEVENPDGSVTRFPGDEQLKKPLKKSLSERWDLLKAELNNDKAFTSLLGGDEDEDEDSDGNQPGVSGDDGEGGGEQPQSDADAGEDGSGSGDAGGGEGDDTASQQNEEPEYSEEEHIQAMKDEGYSDAEIAYILHGHVPAQPTKEELKHADSVMGLQHKDTLNNQTVDHNEEHHGVELDHKKRMSDLEYEHARKEKEIRLKYLEDELAAKVAAAKAKSKGE